MLQPSFQQSVLSHLLTPQSVRLTCASAEFMPICHVIRHACGVAPHVLSTKVNCAQRLASATPAVQVDNAQLKQQLSDLQDQLELKNSALLKMEEQLQVLHFCDPCMLCCTC